MHGNKIRAIYPHLTHLKFFTPPSIVSYARELRRGNAVLYFELTATIVPAMLLFAEMIQFVL